jgi:hypothetical protein
VNAAPAAARSVSGPRMPGPACIGWATKNPRASRSGQPADRDRSRLGVRDRFRSAQLNFTRAVRRTMSMMAGMGSVLARIQVVAAAAIVLAGCGYADSHANLPKFFRQPEQPPREPEAAPDVKRLVRDNVASLFAASAHPRNIAASPPRRDPRGSGWTVCIKASVSGMSNQDIGLQTFVVSIENGRIWNRHRAGVEDKCDAEAYEPL